MSTPFRFSLFGPHSRFSGWTPKKVDLMIAAVNRLADVLEKALPSHDPDDETTEDAE